MKKVPLTPGKNPSPFDVTISDMASQRNASRPTVNYEEEFNKNLPSELKYRPKIA